MGFQEIFAGEGGLTAAFIRCKCFAHPAGDLPDPTGGPGKPMNPLSGNVCRNLKLQIRRGKILWLHMALPVKVLLGLDAETASVRFSGFDRRNIRKAWSHGRRL